MAFNHYLPRRLLRGFANGRGFVSAFDLARNVPIPNAALARVGGQNGLYPDDLESELERRIEHPFNDRVLEKLDCRAVLQSDDLPPLIAYLLAMLRRVPAGRTVLQTTRAGVTPEERAHLIRLAEESAVAEAYGEALTDEQKEAVAAGIDGVLMDPSDSLWHDTMLPNAMVRCTEYLAECKWDCFIAPAAQQIFLGDNPVILGANVSDGLPGGLIFAVANDKVLQASRRRGPQFQYSPMAPSHAAFFNSLSIKQASRFFYFRQIEPGIEELVEQVRRESNPRPCRSSARLKVR